MDRNERQKKYRTNNREKTLEYAKEYRLKNKDRIAESKRKYYANNKMNRSKYDRQYVKQRRIIDLTFRIKSNCSSMINHMLKSSNNTKRRVSFIRYLSYTIKQLKQHLESQFESWMTWENYGTYKSQIWNDNDLSTWTWQIDHIVPQSKLPYTSMEDDNFKKCWALENLRPYSAKQNLLDGVKRTRHIS